MKNKKILILEGGLNEEHEISLETSKEVKKILTKNKIKYSSIKVNPSNFEKKIIKYKNHVCFNALHGTFGEDGKIQKILKNHNIKFTHSGVQSSRNCFDKILTKKIISSNKILTPNYKVLEFKDLNLKNLLKLKKLFKKFVIKPNNSGSSYGIKIIKNLQELNFFIKNLKIYKKNIPINNKFIVEEYIEGKELTVSTIKFTNKIIALAVTEIKFKNDFFDYKAKYSKGYAKHILPANISKNNYQKCLKLAGKSHKILKCNSITRTDFILENKTDKLYFLETNTQPGLTSVSLFPEQILFKKISFENTILEILRITN